MARTTQFARDASLLIDTLRLIPSGDLTASAAGWRRSDVDVGALVDLASAEGASLWLHRRLKAMGVSLAGEAGVRLTASAKRAVAQTLRVDAELTGVMSVLETTGVSAVPLKGAAMRRLATRVPYADARASTDVDLLAAPGAAQRGWNALVARGYTAPKPGPPDGHHLPVLVGSSGVGVEIHLTTDRSIGAEEAWRRATVDASVVDLDGSAVRIPNDTELLWHSVTHAVRHAVESGSEGVRLRYWLDIAALMAASTTIDWDEIGARLESTECAQPDVARRWISTAGALSGRALPTFGAPTIPPMKLERLFAWRLRVAAQVRNERWAIKLLDESARGEAMLPNARGYPKKGRLVRIRHFIASRAARIWWRIRR